MSSASRGLQRTHRRASPGKLHTQQEISGPDTRKSCSRMSLTATFLQFHLSFVLSKHPFEACCGRGGTEERGLTLWKGCSTPSRAESSQGGTTGQSCSAGTGNKDSLHSTTEPLGAEIPPLGQGMLLD